MAASLYNQPTLPDQHTSLGGKWVEQRRQAQVRERMTIGLLASTLSSCFESEFTQGETAMRLLSVLLAGLLVLTPALTRAEKGDKKVPAVLNFKMETLDGKPVNLSKYQGKVVLFVNVASYCGYTKQYKELQALHEKYGKDGLAIVGVPANEFGGQEPDSNEAIAKFCSSKFNVKFDMLSKVVVKGDGICPLYQYLTSKDTNPKFGGDIGWNFTKFLIGKNGEVVNRFDSKVKPDAPVVIEAIEAELKK